MKKFSKRVKALLMVLMISLSIGDIINAAEISALESEETLETATESEAQAEQTESGGREEQAESKSQEAQTENESQEAQTEGETQLPESDPAVQPRTMTLPEPEITINVNNKQTKAVITVSNISLDTNIDGVLIPVWGKKNGQNDIKWYPATQVSSGTWQAEVKISDHQESGTYLVHAYTAVNGKAKSLAASSSFEIDNIKASSVLVQDTNEEKGTFKVKIEGISSPAGITEVLVPVWSASNGQDDIKWYPAQKSGNAWYVTVNLTNHNFETGKYNIHVYAKDNRGINELAGSTTTTITKIKANIISYKINSDQTKVTITLDNVNEKNLKTVQFAVWGSTKGQNDLKWYTAKKSKNGTYTYTFKISDHKESGNYKVHAYKTTTAGKQSLAATTDLKIDKIGQATMKVTQDKESGTFKVNISNISTPATITKVLVPIWSSKNGQDDIKWYTATKKGNAWYVSVDSANHKFDIGTYNIHVYATDSRGIQNIVGITNTKVTVAPEVLAVKTNESQTKATITLKNVKAAGIKNVLVAVWGSENGQNDLKWYTATNAGNGNYTLKINISSHKEAGTYQVHAYKQSSSGVMKISGTATFSISNIGSAKVEIVNKNEAYGTYQVKVSNISTPAEITKVLVPTWSSKNGQDDIKWYTASKKGNAWYVTIEAYNHSYDTGTYISHAYVTDARGIQASVGSASTKVNATKKRQGFVTENGQTYYYNSNYQRVTGWQRINGSRYYFNTNTAAMITGWAYVDGYKYYFGSSGILVQDVRGIIGAQSSYQIKINRQMNCITVYARDTNGGYIIPVVSFVTSTGLNNKTPAGTFLSRRLGTWWTLIGPSYGQYVTQITGNYLFHSVPYNVRGNKYTLKEGYYRKLGNHASAGCVRMTTADAKWIYDNIPNGTTVIIYDSGNVGPFDKPVAQAPAYRNGYGWYDPTDPGL